jgi:Chaperone for flagella basal body P-ring formation
MKRLALMLIGGIFAAGSLRCGAESACTEVTVQANVAAEPGALSLADLLVNGSCLELRRAASLVGLGAVPRAESVRVLDGRQIRRRLEDLTGASLNLKTVTSMHIPVRIVVRRAGATKSCAEIAQFVAGSAASRDTGGASGPWQENFDCAAARRLPEETPLELMKTAWNAPLQRWEFGLRCVHPEDCAPFMIWTYRENTALSGVANSQSDAVGHVSFLAVSSAPGAPEATATGGSGGLVKRGQTATLTWDQAGIRAVLPVTCLDAGGLGQVVRVRFKNTPRIMWAEVTGEGTLRAGP